MWSYRCVTLTTRESSDIESLLNQYPEWELVGIIAPDKRYFPEAIRFVFKQSTASTEPPIIPPSPPCPPKPRKPKPCKKKPTRKKTGKKK